MKRKYMKSSANFVEGLVMNAKENVETFCQKYKTEGILIWPSLLANVHQDMRIAVMKILP